MAKGKPLEVQERWNAEEELLADIDHFRTDYLHNGADEQQLIRDADAIDRLKGRLEGKLIKRVKKELTRLAKHPQSDRDELSFRGMIHDVLMGEVETYRKLHQ
jgi:hypothetical protein